MRGVCGERERGSGPVFACLCVDSLNLVSERALSSSGASLETSTVGAGERRDKGEAGMKKHT